MLMHHAEIWDFVSKYNIYGLIELVTKKYINLIKILNLDDILIVLNNKGDNYEIIIKYIFALQFCFSS